MSILLPPEIPLTDLEHEFFENEPPGLFPQNQDSYWGQMRRVLSDKLQEVADMLAVFYLNMSPLTVNADDMFFWEQMLGIPTDTARTLEQRRSFVLSRLVYGPFTNTRRNKIVEAFITATFNPPIIFTPDGVSFGTGVDSGIPFGSEITSLAGTYSIYQDVRNFTYKVWITNLTTVDVAGLTRELARITPAGIVFTLDNVSRVIPIDYPGLIKHDGPLAYFPLGTNAESIGAFGFVPTNVGAPAFNAAPGLLAANIGADGSMSLNGTNAVRYADVDAIEFPGVLPFSIEAWIDPAALDGAQHQVLQKTGAAGDGWYLRITTTNKIEFGRTDITPSTDAVSYTLPDANAHHVVGTYDGTTMRIYVDGVLRSSLASAKVLTSNAGVLRIGSTSDAANFFNGVLDAVAIYDYCLSDAQIARHHTVGIGSFA